MSWRFIKIRKVVAFWATLGLTCWPLPIERLKNRWLIGKKNGTLPNLMAHHYLSYWTCHESRVVPQYVQENCAKKTSGRRPPGFCPSVAAADPDPPEHCTESPRGSRGTFQPLWLPSPGSSWQKISQEPLGIARALKVRIDVKSRNMNWKLMVSHLGKITSNELRKGEVLTIENKDMDQQQWWG